MNNSSMNFNVIIYLFPCEFFFFNKNIRKENVPVSWRPVTIYNVEKPGKQIVLPLYVGVLFQYSIFERFPCKMSQRKNIISWKEKKFSPHHNKPLS